MSNEIIKILDDLARRFGIAIDWTAENVLPYVKELFSRLVTYNIVQAAILAVFGLLGIIGCFIFVWNIYKAYKKCKKEKESNFFWIWYAGSPSIDDDSFWTIAIAVIVAVVSIAMLALSLDELLEWSIIPEIQLIEWISDNISLK